MNLINDPWIPVRCADGSTRRVILGRNWPCPGVCQLGKRQCLLGRERRQGRLDLGNGFASGHG